MSSVLEPIRKVVKLIQTTPIILKIYDPIFGPEFFMFESEGKRRRRKSSTISGGGRKNNFVLHGSVFSSAGFGFACF